MPTFPIKSSDDNCKLAKITVNTVKVIIYRWLIAASKKSNLARPIDIIMHVEHLLQQHDNQQGYLSRITANVDKSGNLSLNEQEPSTTNNKLLQLQTKIVTGQRRAKECVVNRS